MGAVDHQGSDGDRARVCGRDRGGRLERQRLFPGRHCERRGARGMRALPQLPRRAETPVRAYRGRGRESRRRVRGVDRAAHDQYLAAQSEYQSGSGSDFRSVRECGAHRAFISGAGRRRADHGCRADRRDGHTGGEARGRAPRGGDGLESVPAGDGHARWAPRWR